VFTLDNATKQGASSGTTAEGAAAATAAAAAATATDPAVDEDELRQLLVEIEPPYGVLRPALTPAPSFDAAKAWVADSKALLEVDLPAAAKAVGHSTLGPTFQALLRLASKEATNAQGDGTMYADRDDRAAGQSVELSLVPGGAAGASQLAVRSSKLVELLRIKLEDDGDLGQACKTLRDCTFFFAKLGEASAATMVRGDLGESQYAVLERLRELC
jgi:hypothetical protein